MALSTELYRKLFVTDSKLIDSIIFEKLVHNATELQLPLEATLVSQAGLTQSRYLALLAQSFGVPAAKIRCSDYDSELLKFIPKEFAIENLVFPFAIEESGACIAMCDPSNTALAEQVMQHAGQSAKLFVATEDMIRRALILYDGDLHELAEQAIQAVLSEVANESPTGKQPSATPIVAAILKAALLDQASDLHLEPYEKQLVVRYRIDGQMKTFITMPISLAASVIADLKVKSNLKLDEQRKPQDGRCTYIIAGEELDLRVSTLPTTWGEKMVMRLLTKATQLSGLANLGFLHDDMATVQSYLNRPHGMILITGPTNSGKSTTLYACLQQIELNRLDAINITTIEDPVEFNLPGTMQVQVSSEISFADALRAMLRQDLDVLMVGEIRDQETAELSIRAALAGRLVFSTLHTNDAFATIPRLVDIGVEPYLIASTLDLIIAQRLAKKLCQFCHQAYRPEPALMQKLNQEHNFQAIVQQLIAAKKLNGLDPANLNFFHSPGCAECNNTGTNGRIGLFEVVAMTPELQAATLGSQTSEQIRDIALQHGAVTMFADGVAKVLMGLLSLEELFVACYD